MSITKKQKEKLIDLLDSVSDLCSSVSAGIDERDLLPEILEAVEIVRALETDN